MNELKNESKPISSQAESHHFFSAAKIVAGFTMLSRILGLVRDMVMIPIGGSVLADRFWMAFSIPNLFRRLFGEGALSAAFVPVFTEVAESQGWGRARLVLANVAAILAIVLASLVVLISLGLWAAWEIWGGDFSRLLLLQYTGIMLPFMFTVCMLALGSAGLNCRGHFAYPAFAPIILNVTLIIAAAWVAPKLASTDESQFFVIAVSLLVAGLLQLLGVILLLKRAKLSLMAITHLKPLLPETKKICKLMAPMFIPLSLLQFSAFADRFIALVFTASPEYPSFPLADGVVRCLYVSNRLFQLPLGVLAISIATVVFPLFSRFAARDDKPALSEAVNRALRLSLFMGIPAGVALIFLAEPLIELLFKRGDFTAFDVQRSAFMLQMYCLGMWAYFCNHILLRAFFAIKEPRKPMYLACCLAGLNLILVLAGIFTPLKGATVGLATTITSSINALMLAYWLRRRWGPLGIRLIFTSLLRIVLATIAMAMALWATLHWLGEPISQLIRSWPICGQRTESIVLIAAAVIAGIAVYFLACLVLRSRELAELRPRANKNNDA